MPPMRKRALERSKNAERESAAVFASWATVHERASCACMRWQERHQQRRIGRVEDEVAAEQAHVGTSTAPSVSNFTRRCGRHLWIDALGLHRLESRQDKARVAGRSTK